MEKIKISTEYIKLDQFLKLCGICDSGSNAKILIQNGEVKVNGKTEIQRGKKLRKNDIVEVESSLFQIE